MSWAIDIGEGCIYYESNNYTLKMTILWVCICTPSDRWRDITREITRLDGCFFESDGWLQIFNVYIGRPRPNLPICFVFLQLGRDLGHFRHSADLHAWRWHHGIVHDVHCEQAYNGQIFLLLRICHCVLRLYLCNIALLMHLSYCQTL